MQVGYRTSVQGNIIITTRNSLVQRGTGRTCLDSLAGFLAASCSCLALTTCPGAAAADEGTCSMGCAVSSTVVIFLPWAVAGMFCTGCSATLVSLAWLGTPDLEALSTLAPLAPVASLAWLGTPDWDALYGMAPLVLLLSALEGAEASVAGGDGLFCLFTPCMVKGPKLSSFCWHERSI